MRKSSVLIKYIDNRGENNLKHNFRKNTLKTKAIIK